MRDGSDQTQTRVAMRDGHSCGPLQQTETPKYPTTRPTTPRKAPRHDALIGAGVVVCVCVCVCVGGGMAHIHRHTTG